MFNKLKAWKINKTISKINWLIKLHEWNIIEFGNWDIFRGFSEQSGKYISDLKKLKKDIETQKIKIGYMTKSKIFRYIEKNYYLKGEE